MVVADAPGRAVADIGVRNVELARRGRDFVFRHRARAGPRNHRHIVGARHGDTDLVGCGRTTAVCDRDLEDIAMGFTGFEALRRVIVQRVGPVTVLVDNEIAVGPMVVADAPRRAIADIGIRDVEFARRGRYLVLP